MNQTRRIAVQLADEFESYWAVKKRIDRMVFDGGFIKILSSYACVRLMQFRSALAEF
jgi:hypothetical protein